MSGGGGEAGTRVLLAPGAEVDAPVPIGEPCCEDPTCPARVQDERLTTALAILLRARTLVRAIHNAGIERGCVPDCERCWLLRDAHLGAGESIHALRAFGRNVARGRVAGYAAEAAEATASEATARARRNGVPT